MLKLFLLFLLTRAMEFGTVAKHYILGVNFSSNYTCTNYATSMWNFV